MININEFQKFQHSSKIAENLLKKISHYQDNLTIMEFCGGHTHSIFKYGIRDLLPKNIIMKSGPGCPVCVTSEADLDKASLYAKMPNFILATYGDMLRVPSRKGSLESLKNQGYDIRIVYSSLDAIEIAKKNPEKNVVFFGVGFETTAPTTAASIKMAEELQLKNYFVSSVLKLTIPVTIALLESGVTHIDAVLGPGHVSTIIGSDIWSFLPERYKISCVISGFEPMDILRSIADLTESKLRSEIKVINSYAHLVKPQGNTVAWNLLHDVMEPSHADWRGFGAIPESGLKIKEKYKNFDADYVFSPPIEQNQKKSACRCGDVLRGIIEPNECKLFAKACTPETPFGPCMVSDEGSCSAYYEHAKNKRKIG